MLAASGLAKAYGTRRLFADVSLNLAPGRRVALVGGNGAGKTTLLEILAGLTEPDAGTVTKPRDARIGYLPQDLGEISEGTVRQEVTAGASRLAELARTLTQLEGRLSGPDGRREELVAHYGEVQAQFEQFGGYALEAEVARILAGLGFSTADADRPTSELSGGWRMRVALGRLLVFEPDILLLDEPTNHLDVDSVAWLERRLSAWPGALLFVSHDRDFIDAVADRIVELASGAAMTYEGGFAEFVVAREERRERIEAAAARQAREVARVERFVERFRYKASKARQVQSRIKTLKKLERIEAPSRSDLTARFCFPKPPRSSRVVAELEDAAVGYPDGDGPVVSGATLAVERGQTVALVGPNGAGKSTLLKLILGELPPTSGTVRLGASVKVAAFGQHQADELEPSRRAIEVVQGALAKTSGAGAGGAGAGPARKNLRTILGAFGFRGDDADRRVAELSGGERTRLVLARLMVEPVNLLVLDEPTNHLDLPSCDILEDALTAYGGTVLLVTHDRHLIRSVCDALIEVRHGRAVWHLGADERVLNPGDADGSPAAASPSAGSAPATVTDDAGPADLSDGPGAPSLTAAGRAERRRAGARSRAATSGLRRRVTELEQAWAAADAEVSALHLRLSDPEIYDRPEEVHALATAHEAAAEQAAVLLAQWESSLAELEALD